MNSLSRLLPRVVFTFASKRVIPMKKAKVSIANQTTQQLKQKPRPASQTITDSDIPQQWQTMQFDKLCSLSSQVLNKIQIEIKKSKMNAPDELFSSQDKIQNPQAQLTPYWIHIYKTFCNLESVPQQQIDKYSADAYLAKILHEDPQQDQNLLNVIGKFVNNIHDVAKLQGLAEPTFCKYLLSLKRDLLMQGLDINSHISSQPKNVKILKILNYEYEFWVDVKHNRAKNGNEEDFVTIKKTIDNPNTSIFMMQEWPKIDVTYITRKKKRKQIEMCFCIKIMLLIEVDNFKHVIKVEKKGPSNAPSETEIRHGYSVIDYDGIYNGNQTIKSIFQF